MTRHRPPLTVLEALLILLVAVTWLYLFTGAVVKETRMERHFVLDNTGQVTEVYTRGRVWEQGKGERPTTQEEEEFDLDRKEGEQR